MFWPASPFPRRGGRETGARMKLQKAVVQETRRIAVGTAVLCAAMLIVFLLLGKMTGLVALGALIGYAVAVGNFFVMAVDVQRVTENFDPNDEAEVKRAKAKMRMSYNRRMLVMVVALGASIWFLKVDWIAAMLPQLFPRFVIQTWQLIKNRKTKGSES